MSNKTIASRMQQKHDSAGNWKIASDKGFIPKEGELIIYDADQNNTAPRIKVGNGTDVVEQLPFVAGAAASSVAEKRGEAETSIVFNDLENNEAIAPYSTAAGSECRAGIYGYRLLAVSINEDGTRNITVDDTSEEVDIKASEAYAIGDNLCLDGVGHYYDNLTIVGFTNIENENTVITVSVAENTLQIEKIAPEELTNPNEFPDAAENWVWVPEKPDHGVPMLGSWGAYASGIGSVAVGYTAVAIGRENKALGNYAYAIGRENTALYASHVEGKGNYASGIQSHAEGSTTKSTGAASHAEGSSTTASGNRSHAEGSKTTSSGENSHAEGNSTVASGHSSHAEGSNSVTGQFKKDADGNFIDESGNKVTDPVKYVYISGGDSAHAEGGKTQASGAFSHTEGYATVTDGVAAHAEGRDTQAKGYASHAEGRGTIATDDNQHVQGKWNEPLPGANVAHIVGNGTSDTNRSNAHIVDWNGNAWFAGEVFVGTEGDKLARQSEVPVIYDWAKAAVKPKYSVDEIALSAGKKVSNSSTSGEIFNDYTNNEAAAYAHAEGCSTKAYAIYSHAEGHSSHANGTISHAEGRFTHADGNNSHSEGNNSRATGDASHAENSNTVSGGNNSHAEGDQSLTGKFKKDKDGNFLDKDNNITTDTTKYVYESVGIAAHAEGYKTQAEGNYSHTEGRQTIASGTDAHAEGNNTVAYGAASHAEGLKTKAEGTYSHAEGGETIAFANYSHAEGYKSETNGGIAHAEGRETKANGYASHAEGRGTIAAGSHQHVQGAWNESNSSMAHILGNGTKEDEYDEDGNLVKKNRSNAHTIDWSGNAWFAGDVFVGANKDRLAKISEITGGGGGSPYFPFIESTEHPGCYYRMVTDVDYNENYEEYEYEREEWLNPPMLIGQSYRTTERYQDKPVYVVTISFGQLVNDNKMWKSGFGDLSEFAAGHIHVVPIEATVSTGLNVDIAYSYLGTCDYNIIDRYEAHIDDCDILSTYNGVAYIKTKDFETYYGYSDDPERPAPEAFATMTIKYYKQLGG